VDARHFDHLVTALTEVGSRRGVLRLVASLPLVGALVGLWNDEEADAHGRRKRRVRRHRHGKGRRRRNRRDKRRKKQRCRPEACPQPESPCQEAICQGNVCAVSQKPNNTSCNGDGRCLDGVCNAPPDCMSAGTAGCNTSSTPCCSDVCDSGQPSGRCEPGEAGKPCLQDSDCVSNSCVGYVCQE
jgi:hypothetical protein